MPTTDDITMELNTAINMGVIYNVDYNRIKDAASRLLDRDVTSLRDRFTYGGKFRDRTMLELATIDSVGYYVTQFPSKKLLSNLKQLGAGDVYDTISGLVTKWSPVADKFASAKSLIVKGRKATGISTQARDLTNTGTCACCGKNVKLNCGRIVAHGYTVQHGYFSGECIGVGYKPVEVSHEGLVVLANAISHKMAILVAENVTLAVKIHDVTEPKKIRGVNMVIQQNTRMVESALVDLTELTNRIATWKPSDLPDANMGNHQ